jgi:hypothetical protein
VFVCVCACTCVLSRALNPWKRSNRIPSVFPVVQSDPCARQTPKPPLLTYISTLPFLLNSLPRTHTITAPLTHTLLHARTHMHCFVHTHTFCLTWLQTDVFIREKWLSDMFSHCFSHVAFMFFSSTVCVWVCVCVSNCLPVCLSACLCIFELRKVLMSAQTGVQITCGVSGGIALSEAWEDRTGITHTHTHTRLVRSQWRWADTLNRSCHNVPYGEPVYCTRQRYWKSIIDENISDSMSFSERCIRCLIEEGNQYETCWWIFQFVFMVVGIRAEWKLRLWSDKSDFSRGSAHYHQHLWSWLCLFPRVCWRTCTVFFQIDSYAVLIPDLISVRNSTRLLLGSRWDMLPLQGVFQYPLYCRTGLVCACSMVCTVHTWLSVYRVW